jgi:hypothetical protein
LAARTNGSKGSTSSAGSSVIPSLLPIDVTAARLQQWVTTLGGTSVLWLCVAGLVLLPTALVAGRRRGRW